MTDISNQLWLDWSELHVAIVTGGYWSRTGVGTSVREWTHVLAQQGCPVSVLAPDVVEGPGGRNIHYLQIRDFRFLPQVLPCLARLLALHRRQKIDVVHTHDSVAFIASYLFGRLTGVRNIFTFHASIFSAGRTSDYCWMTTQVLMLTNRLAARGADKLVCVSQQMMDCARRAGAREEKLVLFQNPVDLSLFKPPEGGSRDGLTCLFVGALRPTKGVEFMLRALPSVVERVSDVRVLILGDGPERLKLDSLSRQLGVRDVVQFLGHVDRQDLTRYYQQSDVFVMPSLNEPQGIVALEAMACGLPVVASAVGGIPEMVRHSYNGLLVPAKDELALAEALIRLLNNKPLRELLSQNAIQTAREFSWGERAPECLDLYAPVLRE